MLYLLAIIGAIAVSYALWRIVRSTEDEQVQEVRRVVAPDDDPEFLASLNKKLQNPNELE